MTTKDGCGSKTYYNAPTGVNAVGAVEVATMNVFPNPASDNVAIEVSGINGGITIIELSDIMGKKISTSAVQDNKAQINVGNIASGIYMISCYHNGVKVGTTKLVKE